MALHEDSTQKDAIKEVNEGVESYRVLTRFVLYAKKYIEI